MVHVLFRVRPTGWLDVDSTANVSRVTSHVTDTKDSTNTHSRILIRIIPYGYFTRYRVATGICIIVIAHRYCMLASINFDQSTIVSFMPTYCAPISHHFYNKPRALNSCCAMTKICPSHNTCRIDSPVKQNMKSFIHPLQASNRGPFPLRACLASFMK